MNQKHYIAISSIFLTTNLTSTLLLLIATSIGSPVETQKSRKSFVFSLPNIEEKSRFLSEDIIHNGFDDLKYSSHGKDLKGRATKDSSFFQKK